MTCCGFYCTGSKQWLTDKLAVLELDHMSFQWESHFLTLRTGYSCHPCSSDLHYSHVTNWSLTSATVHKNPQLCEATVTKSSSRKSDTMVSDKLPTRLREVLHGPSGRVQAWQDLVCEWGMDKWMRATSAVLWTLNRGWDSQDAPGHVPVYMETPPGQDMLSRHLLTGLGTP